MAEKTKKVNPIKVVKKKKEKQPKRYYNQKVYNRLAWGGFIGLIALCLLTIFSGLYSVANAKPVETKVVKTGSDVDYRLENYLNNFVYYYFTFTSDNDKNEKILEKLNGFYGEGLDIKVQIPSRVVSELQSAKLVSMSDKTGTFLVSYNLTRQDGEEDVIENVVTEFNVPYKKKGGGYYVSDTPYFTTPKTYQAEGKKLVLDKESEIDVDVKKELDEFLKLFFSNYVSSQENLDLIANDLTVVSNSDFTDVDYSYYVEEGDKMRIYCQVTFGTAGVSRSENFTMLLSSSSKGYFVDEFQHGIADSYKK